MGVQPVLGSLLRTKCYSSQCLGAPEPPASFPFTGEVGVEDQAQLCFLTVSLPTKVIPLVTERALLVRASEERKADRAINIKSGERTPTTKLPGLVPPSPFSLVKKGHHFLSRTHREVLAPLWLLVSP